jgi:predicted neuraminidase
LASKQPWFWFGLIATATLAFLQTQAVKPEPIASITDRQTEPAKFQINKLSSGEIPMPSGVPSAHASSLVSLSPHNTFALAAAWFAGERESAPDVRIAFSQFDRQQQQWTPPTFIASREAIGTDLGYGIRRLGNPVLWLDPEDRLHLFVVTTGLGGWAAARIVHMTQVDTSGSSAAPQFKARQVLPLSWLWNTSHLVRNSPLPLADGGMMLPLYFELGAKYPMTAQFSANGDFVGATRISRRRNLLQPAVVALDKHHWRAYLRATGSIQRIAVAETPDGGRHWTDLPDLPLSNPNAAVAALRVGQQTVLAFNPEPNSRGVLSLAASGNDDEWQTIHELARDKATEEFSYPSLAWADDSLWVSYTDRRKRIAWQRFGLRD